MATGAVAAIAYSVPRLTNDIDLVVRLTPGDASRLATAFRSEAFYLPPEEVILEELRRARHGHFNIIHLETGLRADVYLAGDDPLHAWAFDRRVQEQVGDTTLWLAPVEYVITRKLIFYRDGGSAKHLTDIAHMIRISSPRINRSDLLRLIGEQGVEAEWRQVEGFATL